MSDLYLTVNTDNASFAKLTDFQKLGVEVVIGSEWEKLNFVSSSPGGPGFMDIVVPATNGFTIQAFTWEALSGFYKTRIADAVNKGVLNATADGLPVPPTAIAGGSYAGDWVFQENYVNAGAGNNGIPTLAWEGIYIGDRNTEIDSTGYRITQNSPGDLYDYQLYEWNGTGWVTVAGHSGTGVDADVMGIYSPSSATITRLYMYVAYGAGGDTDLFIGKGTNGSVSDYRFGITSAAPDIPPTLATQGLDTTGKYTLGFDLQFVIPGGAPSADLQFSGMQNGVWGKIRNGTITGVTSNFEDWIGLEQHYERVFCQVSGVAAGATCAITLKAR